MNTAASSRHTVLRDPGPLTSRPFLFILPDQSALKNHPQIVGTVGRQRDARDRTRLLPSSIGAELTWSFGDTPPEARARVAQALAQLARAFDEACA
jgi:hypothetical protein